MLPINSLATAHLDDLLREAEAERLGRLIRAGSQSDWRRVAGTALRAASGVLDRLSVRLDPTIDRRPAPA